MLIFIKNVLAKVIDFVGLLVSISVLLLLGTIFYNVITRYLFNDVDIGKQELEWQFRYSFSWASFCKSLSWQNDD